MSEASAALARIEAITADIQRIDAETGGMFRGLFAEEARQACDDIARILRKRDAQQPQQAAE